VIFDKYEANVMTVLFRPTGAAFGATTRNDSPTKKRTYEIIELLTGAYGAPIPSDYWQPLQIVDELVVYTAPWNQWYIDARNFSTSIYLTNAEQMSYLIMIAPDVELSTYQDIKPVLKQ
jgi:hypothetical protein